MGLKTSFFPMHRYFQALTFLKKKKKFEIWYFEIQWTFFKTVKKNKRGTIFFIAKNEKKKESE